MDSNEVAWIEFTKGAITNIAIGSDLWFPPDAGRNYGEAALDDLKALRDDGMAAADIIRAATINGAELRGWSDQVGQILRGHFADLIAVSADPLLDIAFASARPLRNERIDGHKKRVHPKSETMISGP